MMTIKIISVAVLLIQFTPELITQNTYVQTANVFQSNAVYQPYNNGPYGSESSVECIFGNIIYQIALLAQGCGSAYNQPQYPQVQIYPQPQYYQQIPSQYYQPIQSQYYQPIQPQYQQFNGQQPSFGPQYVPDGGQVQPNNENVQTSAEADSLALAIPFGSSESSGTLTLGLAYASANESPSN